MSSHALVTTAAGVLAVRCLEADEVMHPGVGPRAEAEQLYVGQARLAERLRAATAPLVVFDVGLGAGSNALAARAVSEAAPDGTQPLELVSFERNLGALQLALTVPAAFGLEGEAGEAARTLLAMDACASARTRWHLRRGDLLETLAVESTRADIVFWDPYAPRAAPALWSVAAFAQLRAVCGPRATLFTSSASTASRLALLLAGFAVGVGDAIGVKAQTTAAAIHPGDLVRPLPRSWLTRLALHDVPRPPDAPVDFAARAAAAAQFR